MYLPGRPDRAQMTHLDPDGKTEASEGGGAGSLTAGPGAAGRLLTLALGLGVSRPESLNSATNLDPRR